MANITQQYPIRYQIDTLNTTCYGVIVMNEGSELDCTNATTVNGFELDYVQPQNTTIFVAFRIHGSSDWVKLTTSGTVSKISTEIPDYALLEKSGNTIAQLKALTNIPAFAGKKIRVAIGLSSKDINNAVPRIKLGIKCITSSQILNISEYSPVYDLTSQGQVAEIQYETDNTDTGSLALSVRLTYDDGTLSDWLTPQNVSGMKAKAIQFRADYSVKKLDGGQAKLSEAAVIYTDGSGITAGASTGEIISNTMDWYMNVRHCRMNIRHAPLVDSVLTPYVSFRKRPVLVKNEQLGVGSGKITTYQLKNKKGVKYDTVKLYYDNSQIFIDYEVNTETARITCTPPYGVIITCDYEYGWEKEEWHEMQLHSRESLTDYDASEYRFSRTDDADEFKSVCAVKIVMTTKTGSITKESIGKGTGKTRTYQLKKHVNDGSITIYDNDKAMSKKSYAVQEDTRYVKIAATNNHTLTATYKWISETPYVYQFATVFSE